METLKNTLLNNWHFMRWVRLVMGLFVAFQAFQLQSGIMGLLAGLFLFQALTNSGCCGASGCAVKPKSGNEDVSFEEIKRIKKQD